MRFAPFLLTSPPCTPPWELPFSKVRMAVLDRQTVVALADGNI